jgi:hypothetical protein
LPDKNSDPSFTVHTSVDGEFSVTLTELTKTYVPRKTFSEFALLELYKKAFILPDYLKAENNYKYLVIEPDLTDFPLFLFDPTNYTHDPRILEYKSSLTTITEENFSPSNSVSPFSSGSSLNTPDNEQMSIYVNPHHRSPGGSLPDLGSESSDSRAAESSSLK